MQCQKSQLVENQTAKNVVEVVGINSLLPPMW